MASDKFIYNNTSEQETYSMESTQESSSLSVQTSVEGEQYSADIKVQNDALSVQASDAGNEYDFSAVAETDKLNVSESEEGDEYELDLTIYNDEMYLRGFLKSPSRYKFSLIIENDSLDVEQEENVAVGKRAYYTKEETLQLLSQKADWTASLAKYGIKDAYIEGRVIHLGGRSIAVPESGGSGGGGSSWLDDYLLPIYDDFGNVMGIQSIVGIASDSFLSAKGLDDDSQMQGSFDEELMWQLLGTDIDTKIIADKHISANIARKSDITNLGSQYLTIAEFNSMFRRVTDGDKTYIKAMLGIATDSFLSAKGLDDDSAEGGGGFDEELMWMALGGSLTSKVIADQHLPSNIVRNTRKVAGFSLSQDVTVTNLSDALNLSKYLLRNEFSGWQSQLTEFRELFDAMFELVPATNDEPKHIRAKLGIATDSFLSAKGLDDDSAEGGSGFDEELMWMALGGSLTSKVIADQHLPSNIVRNTRKVAGFSLSQDVTVTNLSDALNLSKYLLRNEFSGWQSQLTEFRELFDAMFELVPATNDEPKHIRAKLGVASDSFLSAKGMDDDDAAGGGFDEELMWMALGGSLANKIIADSHISSNIARASAFGNYYTKAEVAALIPNLSSYYTKEQTDRILTGYASIDFVNSSLSTATATFRGTFETVAALPITNVNVNDYAFVIVEGEYRRYKYNGTSWVFEYTLNNSGYTAEQWSAVNSGITEDLVELIGINEGNIDLNARNIKTNADAIKTLTSRVNEFGESLTILEGLFDSDGKVQNAVNADLLEGHAASYFATKARVDALDTGIGTRIGDLETEIETIRKDYINSGELTNAINALGVPALKTRVQNLETAVGDLDEFVSDFEETGYVTIATHSSAISGLDTRIKANATAISNLSTDYEGFDERLDSAEANISTNTTTITAQGKTIASHTSSISTLTSDVNGLKTSVSDLEDLFDSDGKALNAVTADNATKLGGQLPSYYATASALTALTTRVSTAETNITDLTNNKLNKSVWDSVFEIDANGNLKVKVGLYSPSFITARASDPTTGGGGSGGGAFSLYTWTQVKAMTSEVSGIAPTAYALKQAYNEIGVSLDGKASTSSVASLTTRVASLESKATRVSVSQTLTTGTEIGKITIDDVSKALYAPSSIAWGSVTGKPSFATVATSGKYSDLSGLPTIPSIAGLASEAWVGNNYLAKSGGAMNDGVTITWGTSTTTGIRGNSAGSLFLQADTLSQRVSNGTYYTILNSGNYSDYALPLSGGTLTSSSVPLTLNRTGAVYTTIAYQKNGATLGYLGFDESGNGIISPNRATQSTYYNLIHSGNIGDYALPLSGGTINGSLILNSPNSDYALHFQTGVGAGWIGFQANAERWFVTNRNWSADYTLIHSGNIGSYALDISGTNARPSLLTSTVNLDDYGYGYYSYVNANDPTNKFGTNAALFAFRSYRGNDTWQIAFDGNGIKNTDGPRIGIRGNFADQGWTPWYELATKNSNVASATKLQTARTIWGQSFDGTGNVSGNITLVNASIFGASNRNALQTSGTDLYIGGGYTASGDRTFIYGNVIRMYTGTGSQSVFINSSGNVTIGSSDLASTNYKLYVDGSAVAKGNMRVQVDSATELNISATNSLNEIQLGVTSSGVAYLFGKGAYDLGISTNSTRRMTITSGGNVLIGTTTNSGEKLQVNGAMSIMGRLSGVTYLTTYGTSYGVYQGNFFNDALSTSDIAIYSNKLYLHGNVGIGTTAPAYKLDVAGTANFSGAVTMSSTLTTTGTIYSATGVYSSGYVSARGADTSSDRRLKDNIAPLRNALSYVLGTNYVSFDWKDTREKSIGIIAQEEMGREWGCLVQKHSETYSYLYGQHTALLGAALQEEDKKVEELKAEISRLKAEVKDLKTRLNS